MPNANQPSIQADPNIFGSFWLAGRAQSGLAPNLDLMKRDWVLHADFVDWVATGQAAKHVEAERAAEAAIQARKAAQKKADEEGEARKRAQAAAAFGAKPQPATV